MEFLLKKLEWRNFKGLKALVSKEGTYSKDSPCFVFFHGYGANAGDLAFLSSYISLHAKWIFFEAPIKLDLGEQSYAWFPFDVEAWIGLRQKSDRYHLLSEYLPQGLDEVCEKVLLSIECVNEEFTNECGKSDASSLVLGGFSQGAFLVTELASRMKKKPKALVVLSGSFINKRNLERNILSCRGIPFFQSHGEHDPLLPFSLAQKLEVLFKKAGMKGDLLSFSGGHEIPPLVLKNLEKFLKKIKDEVIEF